MTSQQRENDKLWAQARVHVRRGLRGPVGRGGTPSHTLMDLATLADEAVRLRARVELLGAAHRPVSDATPPPRSVVRRDTPGAVRREVVEDRGDKLVLRFGHRGDGRHIVFADDYKADGS